MFEEYLKQFTPLERQALARQGAETHPKIGRPWPLSRWPRVKPFVGHNLLARDRHGQGLRHGLELVCRWPCCSVSVVSSPRLIIRSRVDLETFSLAAASFLVTLTTLMSSLCSGCARRYQRR